MSDKANSLSLVLCYVTAHNRCDQQHSGGQIPAGIRRRQASPKNGDAAEAEKAAISERLSELEKQIEERRTHDPRKTAAALENLLQLYPTLSPAEKNSALKALGISAVYTKYKKTKPRDFTLELKLREF